MVAAQETTLQKILEGTAQYVVPLYQRPYQWGMDNFKELWRDVAALAEDIEDEPEATHFLGSVVLAPLPGTVAGGVARYLVVDGQQRLTTLTLLLAALRDHLRDADPRSREADRLHNQLLTNQYADDPFYVKLLPTQADRKSYAEVIEGSVAAGGDDKIGDAYRFFRANLADTSEDGAGLAAAQIARAVTSGLSVVSISTHPGDNVHRIFQSLNNTGLKLTQGDLLRNYIFMRLPKRGDEVYKRYWLPLQERLGDNARIETLFWLDLLQTKPTAKQTQTFVGQQARLEKLETEDEMAAEVERLARLGELYHLILHPEAEQDPAVRLRLQRLAEWDSTTSAPLMLHLLQLRAEGRATSEHVARALLYIESLFVRRFLVGRATQGLNRVFPQAVQDLDHGKPVDVALHEYLSEGRKHYATDEALTRAILTNPLYNTGRAAQRKTVLTWIELLMNPKERVDPSTLTIEHVMPQTLSPAWREELGHRYGAGVVDERHDELVHTLGNLTLTGLNESLSNGTFDKKRPKLGASSIVMNQQIAAHESWGPDEIQARGQALAAQITARWPAPLAKGKDVEENPLWELLRRILILLPAGHWTTYGDLAKVLGTAAQHVGQKMTSMRSAPSAHRVLNSVGDAASYIESNHSGVELRVLLEKEGVIFSEQDRALPEFRLSYKRLEELRCTAEMDESD
ncbi:DUF262 domain-containing protein [Sinomonas sp. ASV486]|uniref:GmrSD restriction endonuclease domain-containing protein n=1 Tax=Sinomonas sp. ASV486 TaxID=3051170 RepID=UPI0027DE95C9|nr:DUF262 domain-containing protein [Sinomonas sp. ASV486]MDQ4489036.1 DUF262 domain-containing protein [Sinomonas sp. ASV486]